LAPVVDPASGSFLFDTNAERCRSFKTTPAILSRSAALSSVRPRASLAWDRWSWCGADLP